MAEPTETKSEDIGYGFEHWEDQITLALEDPDYKKFVEQGKKVTDRFLDKRTTESNDATHLNLFHANVITLRSMLYGQSPRVNVERRHEDEADDVARVATDIFERILNNDLGLRTDTYALALRRSLDDYLLPGLGVSRIRYTYEQAEDGSIASESAPTDYVYWEDFLWQPCRNWDECGWVAFRSYLKKEEVEKRFGAELAENLEYKSRKLAEDDSKTDKEKSAQVWEIWCKTTKSVHWYSKGQDKLLGAKPDPLKLTAFYPCPQPMMANTTNTKFMPKADYVFAQDQYNEIDQLQTRITVLTKAVKAVGVYDKSAEGVKRMMNEACENELIPVDNWAMFAEKGGLKGQVDWMPIEAVVAAIEKLREYRDEAINLLYQATGMSDILRGQSTEGRTSATEQNLKAKFASVRIQSLQDMFANFASDLQALKADIISTHYDPMTILTQSNMRFDENDAQLVQPAIQLIKSKSQVIWRVKVRPESVAMVDYAELKQERTDYINALSLFMQSSAPIIEQQPNSLPYMLKLLQWGLAGFKGSQQIEGILDQAIASATAEAEQKAANPEPDPDQQKAQIEQQKTQMEAGIKQQEAQAKLQQKGMELQLEQQRFQMEMQQSQQKFVQEMKQDQQKFLLEMQQLMQKGNIQQQVSEQQARVKMQTAAVDASIQQDAHVREQDRADEAAEREAEREPKEEGDDD